MHLFVRNVDDSILIHVFLSEGISQHLNHDTALDKVIKIHIVAISTIEDSCAKAAKIHGPRQP